MQLIRDRPLCNRPETRQVLALIPIALYGMSSCSLGGPLDVVTPYEMIKLSARQQNLRIRKDSHHHPNEFTPMINEHPPAVLQQAVLQDILFYT